MLGVGAGCGETTLLGRVCLKDETTKLSAAAAVSRPRLPKAANSAFAKPFKPFRRAPTLNEVSQYC
jgi:hypothetical protein